MSIWSIEKALAYGYVMKPHETTGCFSGDKRMSRPSHDCAVRNASIRSPYDRIADACATQCDECKRICHMNDYVRAKDHCPPNYPVPAIPTAHFSNDLCSIAIWPGVMQVRISDEYLHGDYTGFGAVITFEHGVSCETRYDDFD